MRKQSSVHAVSPPENLREHIYERYLAPPEDGWQSLVPEGPVTDGLSGLDPVCLMEVDAATAKHTVGYAWQTIAFCAPACKKQFLADPAAYLVASFGPTNAALATENDGRWWFWVEFFACKPTIGAAIAPTGKEGPITIGLRSAPPGD